MKKYTKKKRRNTEIKPGDCLIRNNFVLDSFETSAKPGAWCVVSKKPYSMIEGKKYIDVLWAKGCPEVGGQCNGGYFSGYFSRPKIRKDSIVKLTETRILANQESSILKDLRSKRGKVINGPYYDAFYKTIYVYIEWHDSTFPSGLYYPWSVEVIK